MDTTTMNDNLVRRLRCLQCVQIVRHPSETEEQRIERAYEVGDYHWYVNIDGVDVVLVECNQHVSEE